MIDAAGLVVSPGFVDLHTHLREPGYEDKETIHSGTLAGAAGGFTTLCCMPNTEPTLDTAAAIQFVLRTARATGAVRVYPIGAITQGRKGKALAELAELSAAGAVAFSDDGDCVADGALMRHALEYSLIVRRPIVQHAEDRSLSHGGAMNEGPVATRLGLPGWPRQAEETVVARDLQLAELTGAHLHVAHASTAGTVDLLRQARARGVHVTAEVTPHHLTLTDDLVAGHWWSATASLPPYDARTKVNPPLRTAERRRRPPGGAQGRHRGLRRHRPRPPHHGGQAVRVPARRLRHRQPGNGPGEHPLPRPRRQAGPPRGRRRPDLPRRPPSSTSRGARWRPAPRRT